MSDNGYVLLTGTANLKLAKDIAKHLKKDVYETVTEFADGEKRVIIPENLRRRNVFIIQPTSSPVDANIMELLLIIDAAKRSSASEVSAIIPYFGYSRQDRKDRPRVPISASLVARLIEFAGADRILTIDIHSEQEPGFVEIPWDNLYGSYSFYPHLKKHFSSGNLVIASPDKGGVPKATFYADLLDASGVAIVFKERDIHQANKSKALDLIGEVKGKDVLIVDDMIDTAGTLCEAADLLLERGAKSVSAAATHGLFSPPAYDRISKSSIDKIFITDTVPIKKEFLKNPKIIVISVAQLLAEAIECIYTGESMSEKLIPKAHRRF
ncbi:ribose-phosphate pyrophosphokinase [Candidatus Daviesbacteria bacterium]|nr:ribose-phosphate pyrophosphokinase [Candidatus Daviesbacteria bacterium]MBI4035359.1 ribose-phosphate pyrophosphokinase [Candidatus Daviesbacteria bacterium]